MFASLRNKFSNYRTCSLRFDIEGNIIIEDFASLRFDNLVICLWCLYYRGLGCSWRCLHHKGLSCIWTCLHYRGLCCSWRCLHHRGLSCIWTCLHNRGLCCSWRCLCHRGRAASERVCSCTTDTCQLTVESVHFASKIICLMSDMFASLRK